MRISWDHPLSLYLLKEGKSTKKCLVPDYLGVLLGVRVMTLRSSSIAPLIPNMAPVVTEKTKAH